LSFQCLRQKYQTINIPIDCRRHEDQIRPQEVLDQGKRDGGSLVNDKQFSLAQFVGVFGVQILDGLTMTTSIVRSLFVNVDPDDGVVEFWIGRLDKIVVL
jgi:hypothetical protein